VLSLVFHDMQYGPQAALIAESFGPATRYSGAGLGYQLASLIAGGPAPLIAAAIVDATNSSTWVSVYIIGCAALSMIALLLMPRREVRAAPSRFDEAVDRGMVAEPEVAGS
jgi:MFS family permease